VIQKSSRSPFVDRDDVQRGPSRRRACRNGSPQRGVGLWCKNCGDRQPSRGGWRRRHVDTLLDMFPFLTVALLGYLMGQRFPHLDGWVSRWTSRYRAAVVRPRGPWRWWSRLLPVIGALAATAPVWPIIQPGHPVADEMLEPAEVAVIVPVVVAFPVAWALLAGPDRMPGASPLCSPGGRCGPSSSAVTAPRPASMTDCAGAWWVQASSSRPRRRSSRGGGRGNC
jgi:hypothetical protein